MAIHAARTRRLLTVPALSELTRRSGVVTALLMAVLQVGLVCTLWRAVYATTEVSAGLDVRQAVTYVVLALLVQRIRWGSRLHSRESLWALVRDGRIIYWFLRPLGPRRHYLLKSLGEILYWGTWSLAGYGIALAAGLISPPPDARVAALAAVSLLLGQVIAHQLMLGIDLLCFWTTANTNALRVYSFSSDLLSGAFVPLWFFPGWFLTLNQWLPFQGTINVPVSIYVGRIPAAEALVQLGIQTLWCCLLYAMTSFLWRHAIRRVDVQGG
ncbi:ABC transporter permease [Actinomadura roseirufa]|uniref:ABC transporter permease n=1 Tax=Actinomadura roseirufa TaxID=2094049 RepID=UPI00104114AC|nr:ABC-2 family transporter protein [Actinomadura roseirufa]